MKALVIVLVVIVVIAIAAALWLRNTRKRRDALRGRFGPEYDLAVEQSDSRRQAEKELAAREERHAQLDIRPLPEETRARFAARWSAAQADFVDSPAQAVRTADLLVEEVMRERGYPTGEFEDRTASLSVEHADVLDRYRAAHRIRGLSDGGHATTEQLREAMVHYRAMFDRLLAPEGGGPAADAPAYPSSSAQDTTFSRRDAAR